MSWRINSSAVAFTLLFTIPALSQTGLISGKITKQKQPVEGAKVIVQNFADEACVKLAQATKTSDDEKKALKQCARDIASVVTNTDGTYRVSSLPSGWYKLIIKWDLDGPPALRFTVQWQGEFVIAYFESKADPKQYSAFAQGQIFHFDGKEQVKDFNWLNSPELNVP